MNKKYLFFSLLLVLAVALLLSCASWSSKLARVDEARWTDMDRIALLSNSPWVKQDSFAIGGLNNKQQAVLDISASWISPYFKVAKERILKRMGADIPLLIGFNEELKKDQIEHLHKFTIAKKAPYELTHTLLYPSERLKEKLYRWPTSIKLAKLAYKQMGIVMPGYIDLENELNETTSLRENIVIDLVMQPFINVTGKNEADLYKVDTCFKELLGNLALRGINLIGTDKSKLNPHRVIIYAHDIDQEYLKASIKSIDSKQQMIGFAPVFIRVLFDKKTSAGDEWAKLQHDIIKLQINSPASTGLNCAAMSGIKLEAQFEFDYSKMLVVGYHGI